MSRNTIDPDDSSVNGDPPKRTTGPGVYQRFSSAAPDLDALTDEQRAAREKFDPMHFSKGVVAAAQRVGELFPGVEVGEHYIRRATNHGKLASHFIAHVVHYSDRDLFDFIVLGTRREATLKRTDRAS